MLLTNAEIELVRLCAWCKDMPTKTNFLSIDAIKSLLLFGIFRISKNGFSYRITEKGIALLRQLGYDYELDRQFRSASKLITRRLHTADLMLFLSLFHTDIFMNNPPTETTNNSFLPAFTLRRERYKNVLGTSRFSGILYTGDTASAVYYLATENDGLYPETEKNTFTMNILTGGRKSAAIFTGAETLQEIISRAEHKTTKSKALTVMDAVRKFDCPVSFVPMSEEGLRQVRIMTVPDYKQRLVRALLKKEYAPPEHWFFDGIHKPTSERFLIGIDFDLPRMQIAAEYGVHIFLFDWQVESAKRMFRGRNAVLHPITTDTVEELLYLSRELPQKEIVPYRTAEGGFVIAPVEAVRKGGK